jgi:hypothetical protein
MAKWIPVAEKSPPADEPIWACRSGEPDVLLIRPRPGSSILGCHSEVTHWQPCPKPSEPVPDAPELTINELVGLLIEGVEDREILRDLEFTQPEKWRVRGVPVLRMLAKAHQSGGFMSANEVRSQEGSGGHDGHLGVAVPAT